MAITNTYPPIGRKGYYSFETIEQQGTRYTWKPNLDRWEISGGSAYGDITGGRVPGINDRERLESGEFAGGTYNNTTKGSTVPFSNNGNIIQFTDFVFVLKSNLRLPEVRLLINGVESGFVPKTLRYSKDDIVRGGDKVLSVKKDGYTSNVEYRISSSNVAGNVNLGNPYELGYSTGIFGGNTRTLGLATSTVVVKKYVNGQIVSSNLQNGNLFNLEFDLKKVANVPTPVPTPTPTPTPVPTPASKTSELKVNVSGDASGLLVYKNGNIEVELSKGVNTITDDSGTRFQFRADFGYEIDDLDIQEKGKRRGTIFSRKESKRRDINPNTDIVLDGDIEVWVSIREETTPPPYDPPIPPPVTLPPVPGGAEPSISLLNSSKRTYDIKDKSGLPISFRKNEEVEAVTVFVGTKHYVFDGLDRGPVAGVVIPSSAFNQIGRVEVKIIPYDLDELDDTIEQITRTQITRTKEVTEERIVEVKRPVPTPIEVEDTILIVPPTPPPNDIPPLRPPRPKPIVIPPKPIPPKIITPPRLTTPIPSGGGGRGSGVGSSEVIDFTDRGGRRPTPFGGFDNADGLRTRRIIREL